MQTYDLIQGSHEWHRYRSAHFNASDAPAMMGVSPYKTRSELLKERATGLSKEIDATTQALFDNGHRFEALARGLAESIIGEDLYPVTGSQGEFSASFDGLTIGEDVVYEHKSLNNDIRSTTCAEELGEHYRIQMEQQLLVSGAEKCLFVASKWDDQGVLIEEKHFWYFPDHDLRTRIIAGWMQFKKDVESYQHVEVQEKPQADAIMHLPALAIQIRGEVVLSNLPDFKAKADAFIASIKTDLQTDADFANAEATAKFCKEAEESLEQAKAAAIAQTASIDELMRTADHIQDQLRNKRLALEKLVKSQKEVIKATIFHKAKAAFDDHVAKLEKEIAPISLLFNRPDFAAAMKGKRTVTGLQDAVDGALANAKIDVDAVAADVRTKLAWVNENAAEYRFLLADLQSIVYRGDVEYFQAIIKSRIEDHKNKEATKLEEERAAIRKEEEAKAAAAINQATDVEPCTPSLQTVLHSILPPELANALSDKQESSAQMNLGAINAALGFVVTTDFLSQLGFAAVAVKNARLYRECDFPSICAAIMRHLSVVAKQPLKVAA